MVDEERGCHAFEGIFRAATLAAVHSYRAVYGNEVGSNPPALMDALHQFWFHRFREGDPLPRGFIAEEDEQEAASGEVVPQALSALETVERYRRLNDDLRAARNPLERK